MSMSILFTLKNIFNLVYLLHYFNFPNLCIHLFSYLFILFLSLWVNYLEISLSIFLVSNTQILYFLGFCFIWVLPWPWPWKSNKLILNISFYCQYFSVCPPGGAADLWFSCLFMLIFFTSFLLYHVQIDLFNLFLFIILFFPPISDFIKWNIQIMFFIDGHFSFLAF